MRDGTSRNTVSVIDGKPIPIPFDGNCLFHSIAFALNHVGIECNHNVVRRRIVDVMKLDDHDMQTLCFEYPNDDELSYRLRMRRNSEWGSGIEIKQIPKAFGVGVELYQVNAQNKFYKLFSVPPTHRKVYLFYNGQNHYQPFVPLG